MRKGFFLRGRGKNKRRISAVLQDKKERDVPRFAAIFE
jgi:hypothetical protein